MQMAFRETLQAGGSQTCSVACCSVTKAGLTLCDAMGCSKAGTSVRGIFQVRILKQVDFLLQGMFPVQGSKLHLLHLLHWQVDSLPLAPPRKAICHNIIIYNDFSIRNIFLNFQVQFSSVTQSCPTLCDPMNHSTPSLPVHHQLPEFTQTQVHQVGDAIQPSHPLLSPSPSAPNPSQHQSLFQ